MNSGSIHIVYRNPRAKRSNRPDDPPPAAPGGRSRAGKKADCDDTDLQLSAKPVGDPLEILRRMPVQVISPALLGLIDVLSGPMLLVETASAATPILALAA